MRLSILVALALAVTASVLPLRSAQPTVGAVNGTVVIGSPLVAPAVPGHPHEGLRQYRQAVVYLETPPYRIDQLSEARTAMHQRNATFEPHLMAVTVGTTVAFPNDDSTYHNVFSLSKPRRFDLGRYAAGRSKDVRFERPGLVRVFCDIHAHMNAFIHVFDHRFYGTTDETGRYRIDGVPPGRYRVTAWYEGVAQDTESVAVAPGAATEQSFTLH